MSRQSLRQKVTSTRGGLIAVAAIIAVAALSITSSTRPTVARAATASTPRCTTAALEVWLGLGGGGSSAGSTYYPMEFTNVSAQTCSLVGFPGVSAYTDHQVGDPAGRQKLTPSIVTLRAGATAHAVLQIADVSNFPPTTCKPVTATSLKVYPPNDFQAALIPFSFRACSAPGVILMHVQPVRPATGIPGYPSL
jgi:Protein of unknown function (DUF4232)